MWPTYRSMVFMCLLSMAAFSSQARESLCAKDEQIAFSCHVGKKIASLCASPDLSESAGYLQYRFGKKEAIEFAFPEGKQHPRNFFKAGINGYSGGGTDYFRFSNAGVDYVVYSGIGKGWVKEGVAVEKNGKRIASLVCRDDALGADNWAIMYAANLPKVPNGGNEFDMP